MHIEKDIADVKGSWPITTTTTRRVTLSGDVNRLSSLILRVYEVYQRIGNMPSQVEGNGMVKISNFAWRLAIG
jgi:hypothetical protein